MGELAQSCSSKEYRESPVWWHSLGCEAEVEGLKFKACQYLSELRLAPATLQGPASKKSAEKEPVSGREPLPVHEASGSVLRRQNKHTNTRQGASPKTSSFCTDLGICKVK